MKLKLTFFLLVVIFSNSLLAQKKKGKTPPDYVYGNVSRAEIDMQVYEKDSTANALVLYEHGNTKFSYTASRFVIQTTVYKKIKIFNADGYDQANVDILLYIGDQTLESVSKIKSTAHNKNGITHLEKNAIYETKISDRLKKVSFAVPNVTDGTVIEYTYTLESPFFHNFTGWDFQEDIPKVESKFKATIPGNFVYNRTLIGLLKLSENTADLKKKCFSAPGVSGESDCEVLTYAMKDIPAFIEEDYMTSRQNYAARIKFEMSKYISFYGGTKLYTTTWKDVDKKYKSDGDIGGQLKRKSFFEEVIPAEIRYETDILERAKKVYYFIQNHYAWNEKYRLFDDMNVKRAYKEGIGTVGEINISLINALDACNINAELALLSTREHGFPTKTHPVITDFNYVVARIKINDKIYHLDATDKSLPFGILPYRCLNKELRVMNFETGSYWEDVIPNKNNLNKISMMVELNDDGEMDGFMRVTSSGYSGISQRKELDGKSDSQYIEKIENENDGFNILSYSNENLENKEKTFREEFEISIENEDEIGDKVYLNPFFIDRIEENPFKLAQREYPVDFGYPRKYDYAITLTLPDGYDVESLPKSRAIKLPNKKGSFTYMAEYKNYKIRVLFKMSLDNHYFYTNEYPYLKELFNQMIEAQSEPIVLKKI